MAYKASQVTASKEVTSGQYRFAQIPQVQIPRSQFRRSCNYKTTLDAGFLVPIFRDEVLPGDTLNLKTSVFIRMATPLHPVMDNMYADMFFFFVPNRLVWDNWQKFCGEQDDPGDSTDFEVPYVDMPAAGGAVVGSLADYFGIPTEIASLRVRSLLFRCYNLVYNEWFRDQNLIDSVPVPKDDGPDTYTDFVLKRRGKRHDYFTSCLPWPQKGTAVNLPLGTSAPVVSTGDGVPVFELNTGRTASLTGDQASPYVNSVDWSQVPTADAWGNASWSETKLETDLTNATAATINAIREAFQIQRLFERDARGGTRYTEIVRSHFGVISPDQRLQRPEYLGGGTARLNVHPVASTMDPNVGGRPGTLAGFVTASSNGHGFVKSFTEHGHIIGLVCIRADLNYQQGLERMFSREIREEFFWPTLQHLGEQAVKNKEIYAQADANDDLTFGYQERYAEYRYKPSLITGEFRSTFATSLDTWHLGLDFASLPVLNESFIEEDPPFDRVIATASDPQFLLDAYFDYKCARPMATYGVPGLIDHF